MTFFSYFRRASASACLQKKSDEIICTRFRVLRLCFLIASFSAAAADAKVCMGRVLICLCHREREKKSCFFFFSQSRWIVYESKCDNDNDNDSTSHSVPFSVKEEREKKKKRTHTHTETRMNTLHPQKKKRKKKESLYSRVPHVFSFFFFVVTCDFGETFCIFMRAFLAFSPRFLAHVAPPLPCSPLRRAHLLASLRAHFW